MFSLEGKTAIVTGTLEQLEGAAVFLASTHSDFMTVQGLVLDGGHTIRPLFDCKIYELC